MAFSPVRLNPDDVPLSLSWPTPVAVLETFVITIALTIAVRPAGTVYSAVPTVLPQETLAFKRLLRTATMATDVRADDAGRR